MSSFIKSHQLLLTGKGTRHEWYAMLSQKWSSSQLFGVMRSMSARAREQSARAFEWTHFMCVRTFEPLLEGFAESRLEILREFPPLVELLLDPLLAVPIFGGLVEEERFQRHDILVEGRGEGRHGQARERLRVRERARLLGAVRRKGKHARRVRAKRASGRERGGGDGGRS